MVLMTAVSVCILSILTILIHHDVREQDGGGRGDLWHVITSVNWITSAE